MPIVDLWAGCRDVEAGREDKPGGLFLDRNRLDLFAGCLPWAGNSAECTGNGCRLCEATTYQPFLCGGLSNLEPS
jgi:hypothetical protein